MSINFLRAELDHLNDNEQPVNRVEVAVSTISELQDVGEVADGSIAWIKRTGEFYAFDEGNWYPQQSEQASVTAVSRASQMHDDIETAAESTSWTSEEDESDDLQL